MSDRVEQHDGNRPGPPSPESEGPTVAPDAEGGQRDLSLEQLSRAYAQMLHGKDSPPPSAETAGAARENGGDAPLVETVPGGEDRCEISPRSILEALLFVGHPENEPVASTQTAALMRGVETGEIDGLVRELNEIYAAERCPYHIVSVGPGYRMQLLDALAPLKEKFYGRIREIRLSRAAIDVLAIVAYSQPLTREEIDKLRGKSAKGILQHLVRRQLLQIERTGKKPRQAIYSTTDRFLDLFGLGSLADLPRSQELDRA